MAVSILMVSKGTTKFTDMQILLYLCAENEKRMKKYFCLLLVWAMCFVAVHSSNAYDFSGTLTKAKQGDASPV